MSTRGYAHSSLRMRLERDFSYSLAFKSSEESGLIWELWGKGKIMLDEECCRSPMGKKGLAVTLKPYSPKARQNRSQITAGNDFWGKGRKNERGGWKGEEFKKRNKDDCSDERRLNLRAGAC